MATKVAKLVKSTSAERSDKSANSRVRVRLAIRSVQNLKWTRTMRFEPAPLRSPSARSNHSTAIIPQRFSFDGHALFDVLQKWRRTFLDDVRSAESMFQILEKAFHKRNEMFGCANRTGDGFWKKFKKFEKIRGHTLTRAEISAGRGGAIFGRPNFQSPNPWKWKFLF